MLAPSEPLPNKELQLTCHSALRFGSGSILAATLGVSAIVGGLCQAAERPVRQATARWLSRLIYIVIEEFRGGDPVPVYRRFRTSGRQLPDGLSYLGSWITEDLTRCYQVMECDDRAVLEQWMSRWADLMSFQVVPVLPSDAAFAAVAPRL